jgi:hypothetical protein
MPHTIETENCPYCGSAVREDQLQKHIKARCKKRPLPHPFAKTFPRRPVPGWLSNLAQGSKLPAPIPLKDLLENSCYYPASGLDASPIIILNGFVHSFIFVDYGVKREDYLSELAEVGFRGYKLFLSRDIEKDEVVPQHWMPRMPMHLEKIDGFKRLMEAQSRCVPFGHWSIWQRRENFDDGIGPPLFSLFFLAGEGIASYQGLYERNHVVPKACSIIQPGHSFGNNWTNFFKPDHPFWQTIASGPTNPEYLLVGNYGESSQIGEKCPFEGYRFVRRTTTYGLDNEGYIYNEKGDTIRSLPDAITLAMETGFTIKRKSVRGMPHTINIFRKE